jgi:hypothetical protein
MKAVATYGKRIVVSLALLGSLTAPMAVTGAAIAQSGTAKHPSAVARDCTVPYKQLNKDNCKIIGYIIIGTNALSAIAGVVIASSIVAAGIQYSSAGSNPQKVAAARQRIINSVLALFIFAFGYAVVQWLVPGGVI